MGLLLLLRVLRLELLLLPLIHRRQRIRVHLYKPRMPSEDRQLIGVVAQITMSKRILEARVSWVAVTTDTMTMPV
jgi:hypothetical protein